MAHEIGDVGGGVREGYACEASIVRLRAKAPWWAAYLGRLFLLEKTFGVRMNALSLLKMVESGGCARR